MKKTKEEEEEVGGGGEGKRRRKRKCFLVYFVAFEHSQTVRNSTASASNR